MQLSKFLLPLCFVVLVLISCEKDKTDPVVIATISPSTGTHSTVVTITGSGFNSNATSNLVKFNGKEATVQSATATQLVVLVPKSAGTGPVSVQEVEGPEFKFEFTTVVSTLAGSGEAEYINGTGTSAAFDSPYGIAVDSTGNIYVADSYNSAIRKITPTAQVTTFAGDQEQGFADGQGTSARFNSPLGLALDKNANLYVADAGNSAIRKITGSGVVTTLAGNGEAGLLNGNGSNAKFHHPSNLAVDATGSVFVADRWNMNIRKISSTGDVTTLAGTGNPGYVNGDGSLSAFNYPSGITIDSQGNLLITDQFNNCVRKITTDAKVSKIVGSMTRGFLDGDAESAKFNYPFGVVIDKSNTIYIADSGNNRIRKISPDGIVTTLAGDTEAGSSNGNGQTARFNSPYGIAIDKNGVIYVADTGNNLIRKIVQE